jgi:GT2 family glycosyltransferase/glycosyltransferase involved in cell wall biosynthesis
MPPDEAERIRQLEQKLTEHTDELIEAQTELSAARAQVSTLLNSIAEHDRRLAAAAATLEASERAIARLEATPSLRLAAKLRQAKSNVTTGIRGLLRRYVSPQTRNRMVRRYPWLRRKQPVGQAGPVQQQAAAFPAATPVRISRPDQRAAPYDVICLPAIEWQPQPTRPQHLASQFAQSGSRVYVVNPVHMLLAGAGRSYSSTLLAESVCDIRLAAPRRPLIYREALDAAIVREMADGLDSVRRAEHISSAIVLVSFPSWAPLAFELRTRFGWPIVYDCMDDWSSVEGIHSPVLAHEETLARSCDWLVVAGPRLHEKWRSFNPRCELLRNGISPEDMTRGCQPNPSLSDLPHPIAGCIGAITPRFDLDLVARVALTNPRWNFVFFGKVINADVSPLRDVPNVHLRDALTPEQAAAHLYHFDACFMPLRSGRVSAADMTRFYEYMSAGKPVIAPPLPDLSPYQDYFYPAARDVEVGAQLERAVSESSPRLARRRHLLGNANAWQQRHAHLARRIAEDSPKASLIIVAYNNADLTQQCIESIYRNSAYPSFEVVVVDNASTDATGPYLFHAARIYPNLQIIRSPENRGFARACNVGIAASQGAYVVILNNDIVTPRGWLWRLLRHLDDPQIGLVGPVTNNTGNEAKIATSYQNLDEMETFAAAYCEENAGKVSDIPVLALYCAAIRRDLLEQIGLLDERFEIGMFEDDDLAQRVRQAGRRVVCAADVFIHHVGEAAFKKMPEDEYQRIFTANRARFERKWNTTWQPHVGREAREWEKRR